MSILQGILLLLQTVTTVNLDVVSILVETNGSLTTQTLKMLPILREKKTLSWTESKSFSRKMDFMCTFHCWSMLLEILWFILLNDLKAVTQYQTSYSSTEFLGAGTKLLRDWWIALATVAGQYENKFKSIFPRCRTTVLFTMLLNLN